MRTAIRCSPLPQGPSLGTGLCCPGPSSLNRPHPPHSPAHRDFAAWRLIRDAFAVRERLSDPRVVPGFHCSSLPGMPPSPTPGSPTSLCSRTSMPTWPSPFDHRLGTPDIPAIRFTREADFVASLVRFRYGLPGCSPPCTDQTATSSPRGLLLPGFQRISLPPVAGYDYNSGWTLLLAGLSPAGMAASLAARSKTFSKIGSKRLTSAC